MVERDADATQTGDELSPAELAACIAQELAQLAELVERPDAAGNLPVFAAQLRAIARGQAALVVTLSLPEASQPSAEQVAAEGALLNAELGVDGAAELSGAYGPVQAGKKVADQEPMTWRAIPEAVAQLSRLAATPVPNDATPAERLATALDAVAARRLQRLVGYLAGLMRALVRAKTLHDERDADAPCVEATAEVAEALIGLLNTFEDMKEAGLADPLARLCAMLADVQSGSRKATFSRAGQPIQNRSTPFREARCMGLAACALDARMKADPERRMSTHAGDVARALRQAIRSQIKASQVEDWRERCIAGERGAPKGFKAGHPAREAWLTYQREVAGNPERGGRYDALEWGRVACTYEAAFIRESARSPQNTGRESLDFRLDRFASSG